MVNQKFVWKLNIMKITIRKFKSKYHPTKKFAVFYQENRELEVKSRKLFNSREDAERFVEGLEHLDSLYMSTNLQPLSENEWRRKKKYDDEMSKLGKTLTDVVKVYKQYRELLAVTHKETIMQSIKNYIKFDVEPLSDIS